MAFVAALVTPCSNGGAEELASPRALYEKCPIPADNRWQPQEKFVWERICIGKTADFNAAQGKLDPKNPTEWGTKENRVLSSAFIETILLQDKYRRALTRRGVRILGARFKEKLDLEGAELQHDLWLEDSLLEQGANFARVRSTRSVSFDGSRIIGPLDMTLLQVGEELTGQKAEFGEVTLLLARVAGQLSLAGSKVTEELNLNGVNVGKDLMLREGAQLTNVDLTAAQIGRTVEFGGSTVSGLLKMNGLHVGADLFLRDGAQLTDVDLTAAQIAGTVELRGSTVSKSLNMDRLHLSGSLFMDEKTKFADVNLRGAHVGGDIFLWQSEVTGQLNMEGLRVDGELQMQQSKFSDITLAVAHIGRGLSLTRSEVSGELQMHGLNVAGDVSMDRATLKMTVLGGARIGGTLNLGSSKVDGDLQCDAIDVERDARLTGATFDGSVDFRFARIKEGLDLSGGAFREDVNLTAAQVGELEIGFEEENPAQWVAGSKLILVNARVDVIPNLNDAWPNELELNGLVYHGLREIGDAQKQPFEPWFAKLKRYAQQPYEQLAVVFQSHGAAEKAAEIRFAGKEEERHESTGLRWVGLTSLDLVIGYGYRTHRALYWTAGLFLVGALVLRLSGQGPSNGMPFGFTYSFDMMLPIIRLREKHYEIDLKGVPRYYFYVHKIAGYVLASFLIAGLSGLTK